MLRFFPAAAKIQETGNSFGVEIIANKQNGQQNYRKNELAILIRYFKTRPLAVRGVALQN